MPAEKLSTEAIHSSLKQLNQATTKPWKIVDQKLHKTFVFRDFVAAFGFMSKVALLAERMNHHPEWCNVYKTVRVDLTTHEAGGITQLDFTLASQMEQHGAVNQENEKCSA